jgi:hypothetical protein
MRLASGEQLRARAKRQRFAAVLLKEDDSGEVGRVAKQKHGPPAGEGVSLPELGSASAQGSGLNPERGASGEDSTRVIG